jgi:hypothetical protein
VEVRKRLLQTAALAVALIHLLDQGDQVLHRQSAVPSNLPEYSEAKEEHDA